jgi:transcription elongation factor Elf1
MEKLYTKSKDYWMDVQMETTECDKCGADMDVMKSTPVKKEHKGYIFVCSTCQIKTIQKKFRKEGMWL